MEEIAIVGLSCLFPGARSAEQFWDNLAAGIDSRSTAGAAELGLDPAEVYDPRPGMPDKIYCLQGGFVRGGLEVGPEEGEGPDDAVRWAVHVAREAVAGAASAAGPAALARCGVVLAHLFLPTRASRRRWTSVYARALEPAARDLLGTGSFHLPAATAPLPHHAVASDPAAAIIRALGLGGPGFTLDAACASSLYAVWLACRFLEQGTADLMLAGAISGADPLLVATIFSQLQACPEDGISRPLDESSRGLVAAQGAGMVVLKRRADALRDGDRIYATIRGIGLSNDGRSHQLLAPSAAGQILAFERAYADAGLHPRAIDYVECHATGTPLGDRTELEAMVSFFGAQGARPLLGAVKANVGHLLTAAGMAGLLKTVLAMRRGWIPATLHLETPRAIRGGPLDDSFVRSFVRSARPWPGSGNVRRAAVNAFGLGGANAHLILEHEPAPAVPHRAARRAAAAPGPAPAALIGMDVCFGGCPDLPTFDRCLFEGTELAGPVPPGRWKGLEEKTGLLRELGLPEAPAGAYLTGFDLDAAESRVPPQDLSRMNPQQLLMLRVASGALRDAGFRPGAEPARVAVVIGLEADPTLHRLLARQDLPPLIRHGLEQSGTALPAALARRLEEVLRDALQGPGGLPEYASAIGNLAASRIAKAWNFSGPAFCVSAGESSSLRALEIAQQLLSAGQADAAVVGAVDLGGGFEAVLTRHGLAPDRRPGPVGEGAAAVVLKRADRAEADGDRIYARLEAVGLAGLSRPSPDGVAEAGRRAFALAGISPQEAGCLELYGGGSAAEREAEAAGLARLYGTAPSPECAVGRAEDRLGTTRATAGLASLVKAALCLHHRYLPAQAVPLPGPVRELWQRTPFYVPERSRPWFAAGPRRRVAAISGWGTDGTHAHAVLAEPDRGGCRGPAMHRSSTLFVAVAGNDLRELREALERLRRELETSPLEAVLRSAVAAARRQTTSYGVALVGRDREELLREAGDARRGVEQAGEQGNAWKTPAGSYFTPAPLAASGSLAFVYPGAFNSYMGQGRELLRLFPGLHDEASRLTPDLGQAFGERRLYPRRREPLSPRQAEELEAELLADPGAMLRSGTAFAVLTTLALRRNLGLAPRAALGYSLGEVSMMLCLGLWSHGDFPVDALTSGLFSLPAPPSDARTSWEVHVALAPAADVRAALQGEPVYLTHVDTPAETVIAGAPEACRRVLRHLGCGSFRSPFPYVLHCDPVRSGYARLRRLFSRPVVQAPELKLYSSARGGALEQDEEAIAESLAEGLCRELDFVRLVERAYGDGCRIFVELGPGATCSRWIGETLGHREHLALSVDQRGVEGSTALARLLARLFSHRVPFDPEPLFGSAGTDDGEQRLIRRVALTGEPIDAAVLNARADFAAARRHGTPPPAGPRPDLYASLAAVAERHAHFLAGRGEALVQMGELIGLQITALAARHPRQPAAALWREADLVEFACGRVANVFGPTYAEIDGYARRTRLPAPPLLFASRVNAMQGTPGLWDRAWIETEYDIPASSWCSAAGQVPPMLVLEASHSVLFLAGYLGLDRLHGGGRSFRVLDAELTFLGDLPVAGETLRCRTRLVSVADSGAGFLISFEYRCEAEGRPIVELEAVGGFFTEAELQRGRGTLPAGDTAAGGTSDPGDGRMAARAVIEGTAHDLLARVRRRPEAGSPAQLPIPSLLMVDRVRIEPGAGPGGLGRITGDKRVTPDDWYFACHFTGDPCVPGSLLLQGCIQLLECFLLGFAGEASDVRFEPITGLRQSASNRRQVPPRHAVLDYVVEVTDLTGPPDGLRALADAWVYLEGTPVACYRNLGLRTVRRSRERGWSDDRAESAAA